MGRRVFPLSIYTNSSPEAFLESRLQSITPNPQPTTHPSGPLDLLSSAAINNPLAYTPLSPGPTQKARGEIAARVTSQAAGAGRYRTGPSTTGSVKSDGGRSSIHEVCIYG